MHKTVVFMTCGFFFLNLLIIMGIHNKIEETREQISKMQVPRFIVSEEPQKIANTLVKTYPYLKMWGPDVLYYWCGIIYDQSQKRDLDWNIICAKIHCESGFNPKAISDMNAKGISQMLDSTAVMTGKKLGITYIPGVTLWNDVSAMILGIAYLDQGFKKEKSVANALKCYYAGSGWRKNKNQKELDLYAKNLITEAKRIAQKYTELYPEKTTHIYR